MKALMKQTAVLLTLATVLFLGACGGESNLPVATGKATIRAINAIAASPDVAFLIEERNIGVVAYRTTSVAASYDDLDYTFNFDVFYAGDTALTRIASQHIDFVAKQEYTLLLTGTVASPSLTLWEWAKREFATGATVFQLRFAQTSNYFATPVDYYFAPAGVAPAIGQEVASLSFGEISPPRDFEAGSYVLTITTAGDPSDVLYTSIETPFIALVDLIISPFDATANDLENFAVQALGAQGGSTRLSDSNTLASVEFLHGAMDLGTSDIYDDDTLLSQVLANHAFTDLSGEIPITPGDYTFHYVLAGGTAAITLQGDMVAIPGIRYRFIAGGENAAFVTAVSVPDRRPIDTAAKLSILQMSNNFDAVEFFLVNQGETLDDRILFRQIALPVIPAPPANIAPGNYDAYVTKFGETDIIAGPVNVNVVVGDVVELMAFDTVDPAVLDLRLIVTP